MECYFCSQMNEENHFEKNHGVEFIIFNQNVDILVENSKKYSDTRLHNYLSMIKKFASNLENYSKSYEVKKFSLALVMAQECIINLLCSQLNMQVDNGKKIEQRLTEILVTVPECFVANYLLDAKQIINSNLSNTKFDFGIMDTIIIMLKLALQEINPCRISESILGSATKKKNNDVYSSSPDNIPTSYDEKKIKYEKGEQEHIPQKLSDDCLEKEKQNRMPLKRHWVSNYEKEKQDHIPQKPSDDCCEKEKQDCTSDKSCENCNEKQNCTSHKPSGNCHEKEKQDRPPLKRRKDNGYEKEKQDCTSQKPCGNCHEKQNRHRDNSYEKEKQDCTSQKPHENSDHITVKYVDSYDDCYESHPIRGKGKTFQQDAHRYGEIFPATNYNINSYDDNYKTIMCKNYRNGYCHMGDQCGFAHGLNDLRYRMCKYAARGNKCLRKDCHFFHGM